jgi:nicotinate-nucleotide adenylyltransferase
MKRIALYGGTFDPVHAGHTGVAQGLLKFFELDEVLFVPAYVAPHKRGSTVTPALQRYAMLALATQSEERMLISTIELDAPERPYTFETLAQVGRELGQDAQLFFVMGADSWLEITTWREWERVLALSNHIVVARPGYELDSGHVTPAVREKIVDLRGAPSGRRAGRADGAASGTRVYITDAVNMDISSTAVRRAVREGHNSEWLEMVPPAVGDYITKYGLYREA